MKNLEKSFDGEQIKAKYQDVFKNLFSNYKFTSES